MLLIDSVVISEVKDCFVCFVFIMLFCGIFMMGNNVDDFLEKLVY